MAEINKSVGERMEILRKEKHMTNEQFAELLSVSPSQVRNYQKGRQPVPSDVVERLCEGNDLLKSWLLGESEFKDLSDIFSESIRILNSFSPNEIEFQNMLITLLNRCGYTQFDIGIKHYDRFVSYMDGQIKSSIETYIKYFKKETN